MKRLFNDGWSFKKTEVDCEYEAAMQNDGWSRVEIPHDWLIYNVKDLYETSAGWYKKTFAVNSSRNAVIIRFDGVYMDTVVYVNGKPAGEWKYGYSSFEFDVTSLLRRGENEIVVKVSHRAPNSRWYSGAGIYRNVYIIEHEGAYIKSDGVYFSAKSIDDENWEVKLNAGTVGGERVVFALKDDNGVFAEFEGKVGEEVIGTVKSPRLWDIDAPEFYTLETTLYDGGAAVDVQSCKVGFRTIEFKPDSGFWLNRRNIKLHGVCLHHDLGALGAAVNKTAIRRQLTLMKEMGANAVRTSHNMPAPELMEVCDELGILVDSEAFDMWELKKTDFDYARFFDEWYKMDVASWIRRDRNHPSVIMWSIGNEIYDTHATERGLEVTRLLRDEVRKHDFNHNAFTTIGSNYVEWEGAQKCADELEVSGYNYGERLYDDHHKKHPDWCIYGSETASRVQSRGVYHFPKSAAYITHDDLQCSMLENCRAGLTEPTLQTSIIADRDTPFCAGQFIWTGADYIGEPSPYSTKNAYYGQIDTAGFIKDCYYAYQAAWTDKTVLRLMPYWDFNDGQLIDVMVYTDQPYAELFFNGTSLGRKSTGNGYSADWQLPYQKGELKAVAYDKDGNITAEDSARSFGEPAKLELLPDKQSLKTDGDDLIYLDISAFDADNVFAANARNRVNIEVTGAGRLIGLDSGDSTDYDEYKGTSKKLFGGKLCAIIAGKNYGGDINVRVTSKGLPDTRITLEAIQTEYPDGRSDFFAENTTSAVTEEIPVRKIEIKADRQHFDENHTECTVTAKILPENAEYDIEWAAVTETGVITNIASVTGDNSGAAIKVRGDGKFRLRCFSCNGKPAPEVLSELEMDVSGLGSAVIDPYKELVKGSLYNISAQKLNEVSEGGVRVESGGKNIVGFKNVDFGRAGSDSFTVNIINWHNNDEVEFSLWSGFPHSEGSECLGKYSYRADFVWQTYIPNTFKLDKMLKGMRELCFEFEEKGKRIYFGGFKFDGGDEAYGEISARDCSQIHGDSFEITDTGVERIGNNVFMDFDGFDFYDGVKSVTIKGRTRNVKDSVHMRIVGEDTGTREILEFTRSDDYIEKTFDIADYRGKANVKFEFLPGCDFDFVSFKFNK